MDVPTAIWKALFLDVQAALNEYDPDVAYTDEATPAVIRRMTARIAALESQLAEGTARLDEQRTRIAAFIREKSASAKWDWEVRHFADHAAEQIEHGWDGEGEAAIDAARKERT